MYKRQVQGRTQQLLQGSLCPVPTVEIPVLEEQGRMQVAVTPVPRQGDLHAGALADLLTDPHKVAQAGDGDAGVLGQSLSLIHI